MMIKQQNLTSIFRECADLVDLGLEDRSTDILEHLDSKEQKALGWYLAGAEYMARRYKVRGYSPAPVHAIRETYEERIKTIHRLWLLALATAIMLILIAAN